MAEENNNIPSDEEIKEVAHSTHRPDEYVEGEAEELAKRVAEGDENVIDQGVVAAAAASEEASAGLIGQGWDAAVTGIQKGIEATGKLPDTPHEALAHPHHDTVTFSIPGRDQTVTMPVYTAVFGVLAVATAIEVALSEILGAGFIRIALLMGIAVIKAGLVVYFYMHLKDDSRVFTLTLLVPVAITLLSMMFLLSVPAGY